MHYDNLSVLSHDTRAMSIIVSRVLSNIHYVCINQLCCSMLSSGWRRIVLRRVLKRNCHFDNIIVTGCTKICHFMQPVTTFKKNNNTYPSVYGNILLYPSADCDISLIASNSNLLISKSSLKNSMCALSIITRQWEHVACDMKKVNVTQCLYGMFPRVTNIKYMTNQ